MVNIVGIYHTLPRLCGRYAQHTTRKTFAIAAGVPLDQAIPFGEPIPERKKVNALSIATAPTTASGTFRGENLTAQIQWLLPRKHGTQTRELEERWLGPLMADWSQI